jgi:cytoskeletal protein CcmA (bactofilin family)
MWKRTEELKPSSPGATAAEPAAPTLNFKSSAPARAEISTSPVPTAPVAAAFNPTPATAPDLAAAINAVSTISAGMKIRGDISGSCHLVIEGETHGKIHLTNGRVTVGANGRVNADIEAPEIAIEGNVQGNLNARDNVRLGPASDVQGSVLTPRIRIEDGAGFRGKVEMTRPGSVADSSGGKTAAAIRAASSGAKRADAENSTTALAVAPRS